MWVLLHKDVAAICTDQPCLHRRRSTSLAVKYFMTLAIICESGFNYIHLEASIPN